MPSNQQSNGDLQRAILDTARHLLVTDGYTNMSMRKIARAIGYSATSIYLHFDSKDALVHALIAEGYRQMYEAFIETAGQHADDPVRRLEALCRTYIDYGLESPEYYEIMYLLHPEQMKRFPVEKYRRARRNLELIRTTLEEGQEAGVLKVTDAKVASTTIWAALHGTVSLLLSRRLDVRIDQQTFVNGVIEQTLKSYQMPTPELAP